MDIRKLNLFRSLSLLLGIFFTWLILQGGIPVAGKGDGQSGEQVYIVQFNQEIQSGALLYLERAFKEAEQAGAATIIMEITTPGGSVEAANQIGHLIRSSTIPVTAFIKGEAFSAGTYVALNATHLLMMPGSAIGAATPIDLRGNMAEQKYLAAWKEKMEAAAQMNDRDPLYARAMVDPEVEIPGYVGKGEILTLNSVTAQEVGYADGIAKDLTEVLAWLGLENAQLTFIEPTFAQRLANFVTKPYVALLLLVLGTVGITIELLIPGFGIAGFIGASSLLLYFFGHYLAGFAGSETLILLIIGVVLLLIEIVMPGFGIFGVIGVISILSSVVLAASSSAQGLLYLGIALLITILLSFILIKIYGVRKLWNRFILRDEQHNEEGYVAAKRRSELLHQEGVTLTPLRPAGTILIEGERLDAISEGGFIAAREAVKVVQVDGGRLIVRKCTKHDQTKMKGDF